MTMTMAIGDGDGDGDDNDDDDDDVFGIFNIFTSVLVMRTISQARP